MLGIQNIGVIIKSGLLIAGLALVIGFYAWVNSLISERDALLNDLAAEQLKNAFAERTIASLREQHAETLRRLETLSARNSDALQKWQQIEIQIDTFPDETKTDEEADRLNRLNSDLDRMLERASGL